MKLFIFQIDAFSKSIFGGNPACVVPMDAWPSDAIMLKIAQENAVAETAFLIEGPGKIQLRWFTPEIEMDLCGHATLAAAHCLKTHLNYAQDQVVFDTASGDLTVRMDQEGYHMDFPARMPSPAELPDAIKRAMSIQPVEVLKSRDYVLVYESEEQIKALEVDRQALDEINLDPGGVVVTAAGQKADFVSRFFTPQASILEDPVTGSAHCSLIPFWADKLGKNELHAIQLSERQGTLQCQNLGKRVLISGHAVTYSKGIVYLDEE